MVSAGGAVEVEIGGELDELVGGDRDAFARCAVGAYSRSPGRRREAPVTSAPTLSTTPANSPPGENGSGGLVWYLPGDDQRVEEIQADRRDLDDDLARPRDRVGNFGEHKIVGRAEAGAENGFHGRAAIGEADSFYHGACAMRSRDAVDLAQHCVARPPRCAASD